MTSFSIYCLHISNWDYLISTNDGLNYLTLMSLLSTKTLGFVFSIFVSLFWELLFSFGSGTYFADGSLILTIFSFEVELFEKLSGPCWINFFKNGDLISSLMESSLT